MANAFAVALLAAAFALVLLLSLALAAPQQASAAESDEDLVAGDIGAEYFTTKGEGLLGYGTTAESAFGAVAESLGVESPVAKAAEAKAAAAKSGKDADGADAAADAGAAAVPTGWTWPFPVVPSPGTQKFIDIIGEDARGIAQKSGLYASVMIAQAILESGSGGSGLSQPPLNNLFGIKGSYRGQSVYLPTSEDDGTGRKYDIMAGFRRYPSWKASMQDYADLLTVQMGRFYAPVWKANAKTYVQACNYLQGHYATDTTYSGKLQGIIIAYDLTRYDHPATNQGVQDAAREKAALSLMAMGSGSGSPGMKQVEIEYEDGAAAADGASADGEAASAEEGAPLDGADAHASTPDKRFEAVTLPAIAFVALSLLAGLAAGGISAGAASAGVGGLGGAFGGPGSSAGTGNSALAALRRFLRM